MVHFPSTVMVSAQTLYLKKCNRSAAPHIRTISTVYVHKVGGSGPLVQIRTTAERLQTGGFGYFGDCPGEGL